MNVFLSFSGTYVQFAIWQSTFCLVIVLIFGRIYSKTPWKSHILQVTGILLAAFTPLFSTAVRSTSGGMLSLSGPKMPQAETLGIIFLLGAALFVFILSYGIMNSRKLMFGARPFPDRESQEALLRHSKSLRNVSMPILFTSPNVKSPTVWCWGLHPAVLLPESIAEQLRDEQRDAVFLHELAHIIRRDHLSSLLARICSAVLFWNPFYWLALRSSDLSADESCDLLVLSEGKMPPELYAETLLRLVAGERPRPIFQFLSRKEKIMRRIDLISSFKNLPANSPLPSLVGARLWTASVFMAALLVSVTLAFCQEKKAEKDDPQPAPESVEGDIKTYRIYKNVADFPADPGDLTRPENAYVVYERALCSQENDGYSERVYALSVPDVKKDAATPLPEDWARVLLNAEILKVVQYQDRFAMVVAKLEGKDVRKPFDLRHFEKIQGRWLNLGNDRVDSEEDADELFSRVLKFRILADETKNNPVKSLEKFLDIDGLNSYKIDKRIADFPDKFDLSSPEAAYATLRHLSVSNDKDKIEKLAKMQYERPGEISDSSRRALEGKVTNEWAKTYKNEFIVFEVLKFNPDVAFVFGLRKFDNLYDGNFFRKKDDGLWYNICNLQEFDPADLAKDVEKIYRTNLSKISTEEPEIDPKQVPKIVKMFPENGATDVDPNIPQVFLTFDLPMGDGRAWASNTADGTALDHDPDGPVFWTADLSTCVAPVKLKPNTKYVVYLNIRPFIGFASIAGTPAEGLKYSFETGPGPLDEDRRKELAKNLFEKPAEAKKKRGWAPEQATGKPDAYRIKTGGDYLLAWASLTPDDREEWLELTWDEPFEAVGIDVYETFNPGALVRVVAYGPGLAGIADEIARWDGTDPTPADAPNGKGISKIRFDKPVSTNRIRLYLDSPKVPGWNEIDAVGLVEKSGDVHWASGATASSTFATKNNPLPEETPVVTKLEPANGAKGVDAAAVRELSVTFDIDMDTESFSWCGGGETFPETTGKPKWIDDRTCILPVELEPGKSYVLGINAPSFKGFQSEAGVPVEPLTYKFSTK